ncbi:unnamed protein product [Effrenium voratum]|uniref:Uncharacterized protein n=1 Tax=Effrenium voratum TaxID=2562239 RepID=A0AA36IX42_9DINO|nr:unnamed protein product [Effrenium voratum]
MGPYSTKLEQLALLEMGKASDSTFAREEFQRFFEIYLRLYAEAAAAMDSGEKANGNAGILVFEQS